VAVLALQDLADQDLLVCPRCASRVRHEGGEWRCAGESCRYVDEAFPVVAGVPALVDFDRSVLSADAMRATDAASAVERVDHPGIVKRMLHPANRQAPRLAARMVDLLLAETVGSGRRPRILVIGGGTVGDGLEALYTDERVDLIAFDIYASPHVQLVADAHGIPLADGAVDGVIIQAVLEHVLEPAVVVGEIRRVLRGGGIVYADTPFMQQVHEGPYDFSRFTESGHRYLFRDFEELESGLVAGAGTSLRWSIGYFVRALTRSATLGRLAGVAFFWLSHLDRFLDPRHSLDGANSVYFLGRKGGPAMTPSQVVEHYRGGM
jgi:SAM-dependent methyltransferase